MIAQNVLSCPYIHLYIRLSIRAPRPALDAQASPWNAPANLWEAPASLWEALASLWGAPASLWEAPASRLKALGSFWEEKQNSGRPWPVASLWVALSYL